MTSLRAARRLSRRAFVGAAAAVCATSSRAHAQPDDAHGPVKPPMALPDIAVVRHDGAVVRLPALVERHATAFQLMFTACTVTCPIQGAIFERVQSLIPDQAARAIQLLSLSVDPLHDTPAAMTRWLRRFHAGPCWVGAAPRVRDVERVRALGGPGREPSDNHSTQVQIVNREGRLVWRTFDLPEAEEVASILGRV